MTDLAYSQNNTLALARLSKVRFRFSIKHHSSRCNKKIQFHKKLRKSYFKQKASSNDPLPHVWFFPGVVREFLWRRRVVCNLSLDLLGLSRHSTSYFGRYYWGVAAAQYRCHSILTSCFNDQAPQANPCFLEHNKNHSLLADFLFWWS